MTTMTLLDDVKRVHFTVLNALIEQWYMVNMPWSSWLTIVARWDVVKRYFKSHTPRTVLTPT